MNEPAPSTVNVATTDVLIIGAGPTGLTLACDLARRGVSFLLLERSTTPSTASRAKTIQPRTMEVADNLGVAGRVLTEGRVNVPTRHYDRARVVSEAVELAAGVRTTDAPYPPVWLSQPRFEQILRDHLTELGGTVHWGSEVTDLQQDGDGVTATVTTRPDAGSRTVHARYAVGVDGGRSTVRALAGIELHGTSLTDQRWHLGDVRVTGLSRHCQHLWTSKEDGLLSLFPLPGTDLWQFQASIPADPAEPEEPSLELFRRIFAERAGVPGVVIQDVAWLSLYRINVLLADHYRSGRILLAGDAAHIHSPVGGQGMNTGIQDAYNLGWKLAALLDGADPALLDTYEHERRPVARSVLDDSTTRLGKVMRALGESAGPSAQQGLTDDRTTGLGVAYTDSPLTHGPGAGVRAPDAPCRNAGTGRPTRLFDLLRGPHWTLLSFGSTAVQQIPDGPRTIRVTTDLTATGADAVIDADGLAHHAYGTAGDELVLIRPDGYIATRRPASDLAAVLALAAANGM
ncbi:FAD-dependent oxidoreductase [Streptomyces sp. NBC_01431]|uniref:FAD-dependent oxidoreductase n=1 Tax=Streptomyces sp. NBC_01431 TaxID=2903863 RepID=UPI002E322D2A|nr:FAD-dependent oxidoreductase [Streptomyces sp. NBC_01431]